MTSNILISSNTLYNSVKHSDDSRKNKNCICKQNGMEPLPQKDASDNDNCGNCGGLVRGSVS